MSLLILQSQSQQLESITQYDLMYVSVENIANYTNSLHATYDEDDELEYVELVLYANKMYDFDKQYFPCELSEKVSTTTESLEIVFYDVDNAKLIFDYLETAK